MPFHADRLAHLKESTIRNMSLVAQKYGAVNWAQGLPEDDAPKALKQACIEAIETGYNQYARTFGVKELGLALEKKLKTHRQWVFDAESMVTICCGGTEAMMASFLATLNPGDEVLVFSPYYENFRAELLMCGAVPVFVPLASDEHLNFSIDWQALEQALSPKTRALILNTPHNPTGKVFSREEMSALAQFVEAYDLLVLTDETYEYLVYDGYEHLSFATLPGMQERTITIGSLSKSYAATGWRVAWAIAPESITKGIRAVNDFLTISAPHPMQRAAITALELPESYYTQVLETYTQRKNVLCKGLDALGLTHSTPQGAYYLLWDIAPYLKPQESCMDFALRLTQEAKVATVPGVAFTSEDTQWVRLSFCKHLDTLETGLDYLGKWLERQ